MIRKNPKLITFVGLHAQKVGRPSRWQLCQDFIFYRNYGTTYTFKTDSAFRKRAIWRLEKNLEFLKSCKSLEAQLDHSDVHVETVRRLENLALHSTLERSGVDVSTFLYRNLDTLEYALASSRACTPEFRRRHILGNSQVSYITRTIGKHLKDLNDALIERIVHVYLGIACPDVVHFLVRLLDRLACNFSPKVLSYCSKVHAINGNGLMPDELVQMSRRIVDEALKYKPAACSLDAFVEDLISVTKALHGAQERHSRNVNECNTSDDLTSAVYDYTLDYIYLLDPPIIVHALWGIHSMQLTYEDFYVHAMQALLFKYKFLWFNIKTTIYMLLGYLKHMWLVKGGNVACSIYDESCQMLNAKLRRDIEDKLELVSLDDALNLSLTTALLFRQCKVVRKIMLSRFEMLEWPQNPKLLLKALATCNTLYIGPSFVDVSLKLATALNTTACKFDAPDAVHALEYCQHVLARRHTKHLLPLFEVVLSSGDVMPHVGRLIYLYGALGMHKHGNVASRQPPLLEQLYSSLLGPIHVAQIPSGLKYGVKTGYKLLGDDRDNQNVVQVPHLCMNHLVVLANNVKRLQVDMATVTRLLNGIFDAIFCKIGRLSDFLARDSLVLLGCMQHFRMLHLGLANKCLESLRIKFESGQLLSDELSLCNEFVDSLDLHVKDALTWIPPLDALDASNETQLAQLPLDNNQFTGTLEQDLAVLYTRGNSLGSPINGAKHVRLPKSGVAHAQVKAELQSLFPNEEILEMHKFEGFVLNFYVASQSLAVLVPPKDWFLIDVDRATLHATRNLAECFQALKKRDIRLMVIPKPDSKVGKGANG